jgi:hypothetical protein
MIRDLLGFSLGALFGLWLGRFVIQGLRTGRIHHTDSASTYSWKEEPFRFAFVTLFFTALSLGVLWLAAERAISAWQRFRG